MIEKVGHPSSDIVHLGCHPRTGAIQNRMGPLIGRHQGVNGVHELGLDRARLDQAHPDPRRVQFAPQRVIPVGQARLGRAIAPSAELGTLVIAEPMLTTIPRRSTNVGNNKRVSIRGAVKLTTSCRASRLGSEPANSVGKPSPALLIKTSSAPKRASVSATSRSGVTGSARSAAMVRISIDGRMAFNSRARLESRSARRAVKTSARVLALAPTREPEPPRCRRRPR